MWAVRAASQSVAENTSKFRFRVRRIFDEVGSELLARLDRHEGVPRF
jgi:hypothetical protein